MSDKAQIKALLQARIVSLAAELAPEGYRSGAYWMAKNPTRADGRPGSFVIWLVGHAPGGWKDYAGDCDRGGRDTGDVIDLVRYCRGYGDDKDGFRQTMTWAAGWLGLAAMPAEAVRAQVAASTADQARQAATAEERLAESRRKAFGLFLAARKRAFLGSPADLYLQSARGIWVTDLQRMPGCLGWLPDCAHAESGRVLPAMVSGMTGVDGRIQAVHRVFIEPDGRGGFMKSTSLPVRKIWPSYQGAVMRIWRGGSKLSSEDAARQGLRETLVLVEGVEDGLSVALAWPELRVWGVGALNNLAHVQLPECCDQVVVCADNDWGKPQAAKELDKGVAALVRQGARVSIARSPIGKDANDALRGIG